MILNFRQLEIFRAIMVAKTISGAADILHVSQPGISRTLKYMEMKLGMDLFERRQNGLIPTPEAIAIYKEVQPLYEQLENLDNDINRILRTESSFIQIGCSPSLAQGVLPKLLKQAQDHSPNTVAKIDTMSNEYLPSYIVQRKGDFALSTYDPNHPLILAEKSIQGQIDCIVPIDHELAKKDQASIAEIAQYPMIGYYDDTYIGQILNNQFETLNITPKLSVQVRFNPDVFVMVSHGLGVGFIYRYANSGAFTNQIKVIELTDELKSIPIYLLRHRGFSMPNSIRHFYDSILKGLENIDI